MNTLENEKWCSGCDNYKNLDEFYSDKSKKFGKSSFCKKCCKEKSSVWEKANPDKKRVYEKRWRDANKEKERRRCAEKYSKTKEKRTLKIKEWKLLNLEKVRAYTRKSNNKHKERRRETTKLWLAKNPEKNKIYLENRRAAKMKNGGQIYHDEWVDLCEKYGNRCINPNCPDPSKPLTIDHVVPIKMGGSNTINNVQPLCQRCNSSKNVKIIDYRIEKYYEQTKKSLKKNTG